MRDMQIFIRMSLFLFRILKKTIDISSDLVYYISSTQIHLKEGGNYGLQSGTPYLFTGDDGYQA